MLPSVLLGLFAGRLLGNGLPHFVAGITRRSYPNVFGDGPVPNVVGGWVQLAAAAGLVFALTRLDGAPSALVPLACGALGVLAAALFHAFGLAAGARGSGPGD
jgi:hypothetical protein